MLTCAPVVPPPSPPPPIPPAPNMLVGAKPPTPATFAPNVPRLNTFCIIACRSCAANCSLCMSVETCNPCRRWNSPNSNPALCPRCAASRTALEIDSTERTTLEVVG